MRTTKRNAIKGHLTTVYPSLRHRVVPYASPPGELWNSDYTDGEDHIPLSGILNRRENVDRCVILVHGLGGSPDAAYVAQWSTYLFQAGFDVLRIGLRGSDGNGDRFYHVGLTNDVEHAVDEMKRRYGQVFVLGFSLGAHITLRCATLGLEINACCAVSPPIDLIPGVEFLDSPSATIYRIHVLRELVTMYRAMEQNGAKLPATTREVKKIKTIREWDEKTICPAYGYESPDAYYSDNAMISRLDQIVTPTYALIAPDDPMIAIETVKPHLERVRDLVETRYIDGAGHVFFPYSKDPTIVGDVLRFFERHS